MARYYNKNSKNLFPCGFSLIVNSHKTFTAQEIHHLFNEFQLSTFRTNVCIHENPYQCLFVCEACLGTSEWQNKESIRNIIDDQMGKHIFFPGKRIITGVIWENELSMNAGNVWLDSIRACFGIVLRLLTTRELQGKSNLFTLEAFRMNAMN